MTFTASFAAAFRDYNTDGVPGTGPFDPVKAAIRALGVDLDKSVGWSMTAEQYGAAGDGISVDTAALNSAAVALSALGGSNLQLTAGKTYLIDDSFELLSGVYLQLNGATVEMISNNVPICKAPSSLERNFGIIGPGSLVFTNQQNSGQTNGVAVRLADGSTSFASVVQNVFIDKACTGVDCPATSGSFAFDIYLENLYIYRHSGWSVNIDCDSGSGANTNLIMLNVYGVQDGGAPNANCKGHRISGCVGLLATNLIADYLQGGQCLALTSVLGTIGYCHYEAFDFSSAGTMLPVAIAGSEVEIDMLLAQGDITLNGSDDCYFFRPTDSGAVVRQISLTLNVTVGGGTFYTVVPAASTFANDNYVAHGSTPAVNLADFGELPLVTRWDGSDRARLIGGHWVTSGAAAPVSGAWTQGDWRENTAPAAAGNKGWVCTGAGSPGTWKTFGAIAA